MALKLPYGDYWYSDDVKISMRWERAVMTALLTIFAGIYMLGGYTIKANNSWLGYKTSKAMSYTIKALYKNDILFHSRLG